ncbi:ribonuclease HII [Rubrobacter calidifluminis]|uniref:ribonuclease HII n=1 Tax=Rubrobacter calidifluminis TaxID=1392640 RepID=UPI0023631574|nr:ribonuclease HII [Rubrobacter calidifluminis]
MSRVDPPALYAFDAAWTCGRRAPLAGTDEAGRGALAGPLVAAAVVLGRGAVESLADSKALRPERRELVYRGILDRAESLSVVSVPAWWIDRQGIGTANCVALERAISLLEENAGCYLADGSLRLGRGIESLPGADACSAVVAAASVVAKVLRDAAMSRLAAEYPGYGFERNRGYGTRDHRLALAELGPCRVHRLSYAGVRSG